MRRAAKQLKCVQCVCARGGGARRRRAAPGVRCPDGKGSPAACKGAGRNGRRAALAVQSQPSEPVFGSASRNGIVQSPWEETARAGRVWRKVSGAGGRYKVQRRPALALGYGRAAAAAVGPPPGGPTRISGHMLAGLRAGQAEQARRQGVARQPVDKRPGGPSLCSVQQRPPFCICSDASRVPAARAAAERSAERGGAQLGREWGQCLCAIWAPQAWLAHAASLSGAHPMWSSSKGAAPIKGRWGCRAGAAALEVSRPARGAWGARARSAPQQVSRYNHGPVDAVVARRGLPVPWIGCERERRLAMRPRSDQASPEKWGRDPAGRFRCCGVARCPAPKQALTRRN